MNSAMKSAESGCHGAGGDEVTFENEGAEDDDGDHERHGEIDRGSAGSDGGIGGGSHGAGRIIKIGFCGNCQFLSEKLAKNRGIWSWWGCPGLAKVVCRVENCGIRCRNRSYFCCKLVCFLLIRGVTDRTAADIQGCICGSGAGMWVLRSGRCACGESAMAGSSRGLVVASMGLAALMALLAVADFATGVPFGSQTVFDVMFILASGLVIYMGVNCLKDAR